MFLFFPVTRIKFSVKSRLGMQLWWEFKTMGYFIIFSTWFLIQKSSEVFLNCSNTSKGCRAFLLLAMVHCYRESGGERRIIWGRAHLPKTFSPHQRWGNTVKSFSLILFQKQCFPIKINSQSCLATCLPNGMNHSSLTPR